MAAKRWGLSLWEGRKRSFVISIIGTLLYSGTVFLYSVSPSSNVSISGSLWQTLVFSVIAGAVTIGVPIFLWRRYELWSPGMLLICILIFWHVLVYVPPIGTGQGDSPGFLFVFLLAPIYLVGYVVLATTEYWIRSRDNFWSPSAQ